MPIYKKGITRRAFVKMACAAFPAVFAPWPAGAVEGLAKACHGSGAPIHLSMTEYFRTGINMILMDRGIYVVKVVSEPCPHKFSTIIIKGLCVPIQKAKVGGRKNIEITAALGHHAKYFAFEITEEAKYHVEIRQNQLKEAINSILKAYGKRYI